MKNIKRLVILLAITTALFFTISEKGHAIGTFKEGTVTKKPWKNNQYYIGIDKKKYLIMPDAKILLPNDKIEKLYRDSLKARLKFIKKDTEISFKSNGFTIYQIIPSL